MNRISTSVDNRHARTTDLGTLPNSNRHTRRRFGRAPYQRSPDRGRSKLRRQTLAATSPLPPRLAARLTPSQLAYARFVVDEQLRAGDCRLSLDEIAARCGVCCKTVQRAQYRLQGLSLVEVEQRPIEGGKNLTNVVRIVCVEWLTWIAMGRIPKRIGGQRCLATANKLFLKNVIDQLQRRRDAVDRVVEVDAALDQALGRLRQAIRTSEIPDQLSGISSALKQHGTIVPCCCPSDNCPKHTRPLGRLRQAIVSGAAAP